MKNKMLHLVMVIALALNAVLPAYAAISIQSHNNEQLEYAAFYGEDAKLLICTSEGFKYVSVSEITDEEPMPKLHCKSCLAGAAQDIAAGADTPKIMYELAPLELVNFVAGDDEDLGASEKSQNLSRAPPAIS